MKTISTSELRSRTRSLVRTLEGGKPVSLTYRGNMLAKIWPLKSKNGVSANDPLYHFHHFAEKDAERVSDRDIDKLVYGG